MRLESHTGLKLNEKLSSFLLLLGVLEGLQLNFGEKSSRGRSESLKRRCISGARLFLVAKRTRCWKRELKIMYIWSRKRVARDEAFAGQWSPLACGGAAVGVDLKLNFFS